MQPCPTAGNSWTLGERELETTMGWGPLTEVERTCRFPGRFRRAGEVSVAAIRDALLLEAMRLATGVGDLSNRKLN